MSGFANHTRRPIRRAVPVALSLEEHEAVMELSNLLSRLARSRNRRGPACRIVGPDGAGVSLPEPVLHALARVAALLGRGDAVAVVPAARDLTTQQAADILNVSRQYLVRLLDEGRIPCARTGKHRRVRLADVMTYKTVRDRRRRAALLELTRLSEEAGGYGELGQR